MKAKLLLLALLLTAHLATSASAAVVINEVELDEGTNGTIEEGQWIELYNTGDEDVDISFWSIVLLSDRSKEQFLDVADIPANGFFVITFDEPWMDPNEESLILKDDLGNIVDRTPLIYDYSKSSCAWTRYPDGSDTWLFLQSSQGQLSTGESCDEAGIEILQFDMDQTVRGSGYMSIHNNLRSRSQNTLKSRESGTGAYSSEEGTKFYADLNGSAYSMDLTKSNLSARHAAASFSVTPTRSVIYSKKWKESTSMGGDLYPALLGGGSESASFSESADQATRLDSDLIVHYKNFDVGAKISSDFEGVSRIKSDLADFKSSEEYSGSFKIENDYRENASDEITLSVSGEGFASTNKEIGEDDTTNKNRVVTYGAGTGLYNSEELIQTSDISRLNMSRIAPALPNSTDVFLARSVSLRRAPASNHSYARVSPDPMTISWSEGLSSSSEQGAFISSEFSDISELNAETVMLSSKDMRTSADFTGRASMKAGYNYGDPWNLTNESNQSGVYIEEDFVGNFSIKRSYKVYPERDSPHLSLISWGRADPQDCRILHYVISLVNDGNRPLGPIFVRTSFPSGTSYLGSSVRPFELSARYANWSVPYISIGEAASINLDLLVTSQKDEYSIRSRGITVYQVIRSYPITDSEGNVTNTFQTSSDRRLSASNSSTLSINWSECEARNLSVAYTATTNAKAPKMINYRLMIENLAQENISANITVKLPAGIRMVNSTSRYENISQDMFGWTVDRLNAGKRRSISFIAQADGDGLYISNASISTRSRDDGRQIESAQASSQVMIGKTVYSITPTFWQDWCPCSENLLGKLSWNETSLSSGKELKCIC